MYKLEKILIGLDQTSMDADLVKAAAYIGNVAHTKEIYFFNVIRDFNMPDEMIKEFPDLLEKGIADRKAAMQKVVEENFDCKNQPEIHYMVEKGQPTKIFMKLIEDRGIDLVMVGRKKAKKGGGIIIHRLARRAGCSLLIVPEKVTESIKTILVPIDFSEYSSSAMDQAIEVAKNTSNDVKIIAQNVYQVPSGYHYTGKSFEEFGEVMRKNAENSYKGFIKKIDAQEQTIEPIYSLDKGDDPIKLIYETAKDLKVDGIIFGAKGRSATTALFIGSTAEKLINVDVDIPVMVVRPKGKQSGILDYIREI